MQKINRRQFLTLSAGTAGAILLTRYIAQRAFASGQKSNASSIIQSQNGLLDVFLTATANRISVGNQQGTLMSYSGQIPGPRLEAKPGDIIRIRLTNQLAEPTNLHYHGLHISPTDKADNIFRSIAPGETADYEFTIPIDHSAGTFYYHPHLHGSVAEQVFAGMGGIFVVRGALDEIPEIRSAQEEFLFLKDFALDANGRIPTPGNMALMQGREGEILTVNGQQNPSLSIPSGGLLRLRIVNASASRFYRLAIEEHPFYLIATDGGAIEQPIELRELLLTPGERAEVLIRGERQPGTYRLLNLPYDRGGMSRMRMMNGMMHSNSSQAPQTLATLRYQGAISPLPLPQQLLPVELLPEPVRTRRIEFSMAMEPRMSFLFNGDRFDPNRIDAAAKLGTVEDWELVNIDPDGMEHPFHLHVNPFQVISRDRQPAPYRAWKDTVLVGKDETVRIRIPFRDFAGKTVYHCHVLDHEDLGMMGIVEMQS